MARKKPQSKKAARSPSSKVEAVSAPRLFPIVAVGASAGGMEAFIELLRGLPAKNGMAIVFVQHLDPTHPSALVEIVSRTTETPVSEARHGTRLEPDRIYVIPHDAGAEMEDGVIVLTARASTRGGQTIVDTFMRSLAETAGIRSVGVILSGNASDGTLGLKAIKEAGGLTFAQEPATAKFDGMPRSAVLSGCVDFTLPPKTIGRELRRIGEHPWIAPTVPGEAADPAHESTQGLTEILSLIRAASGVDFTFYKSTTIKRRILRRMILHRKDKIAEYVSLLRSQPAEARALYEDILINVTQFFRDPETFESLKESVLPKIVQNRPAHDPLRIWVPGCATGEEVYSLAVTVLEYLEKNRKDTPLQIFATDLSESALDRARAGVYSRAISQEVSPERLKRFFTKVESGYQISKRVREMCVFARQNLAKDPPFSRLDLISCRNVLIYLNQTLQKRVIPVFHYALRPAGYLLLGSSETIGAFPEMFALLDKKHKIYSKRASAHSLNLDFAVSDTGATEPGERHLLAEPIAGPDLQREADRLVLARYGPPGVIVDEEMTILQFRGKTSPFLEPSSGAASLSLMRMAKEGLALELRNALHRARKTGAAVRREAVPLKEEGTFREVDFEILPLRGIAGKQRRFLVLFENTRRKTAPPVPVPAEQAVPRAKLRAKADLDRDNERLYKDLNETKDYLQSIIEELEASNEELRSANEEIQSSNEELQSTNEELETAKEELQSTNEELNTVNEELQSRNLQLSQLGNDLLNLLSNVSIPIVMLGNDLRIRRFTPASERVLNLIPTDVGRPISDIQFKIEIPNLMRMLNEVIETLAPMIVEVGERGAGHSLRIRPYRTEDNKIDGVVMMLVDLEPSKAGGDAGGPASGEIAAQAMIESDRAIQDVRARLNLYTRSLIWAQEDERRRVSRELHDDLNQRLALLSVETEQLELSGGDLPLQHRQHLAHLKHSVNELSEQIRRIAHALHPSMLDELGLVAAIETHVREVARSDNVQVKFRQRGVPSKLAPEIGLSVFRVIQEAVRNAVKHSRSKTVTVNLHGMDSFLNLSIRDNGKGFNPDAAKGKGLGLIGMEERILLIGGTYRIQSKPGDGTRIDIQVPLKKAQEPTDAFTQTNSPDGG